MKPLQIEENCPSCEKPQKLCVCDDVTPLDNRVFTLILRHPQEQDKLLGTARIATLQLKNAALRTGLSWANLSRASGIKDADPKKWGILYLGTAKTAAPLPPGRILTVLSKKGAPLPEAEQGVILKSLEGIILLDGNWAQAKALWWRNAWLLKCRRLVLQPPHESLYGNLRKEPRRESVSTIEAAAYTLATLDGDDNLAQIILKPFAALIDRARKSGRKF